MDVASSSTFRYQLGAVLTNKKFIIGRGFNSRRYHKLHNFYNWKETLHAEAAAVLDAPKTQLAHSTIHIARINKAGEPLLAHPCSCCLTMLRCVGIRRAVYTIPDYPFYAELTF
jgi:tRNA(Arg) A34 adenosine deaminase TadA